MLPRIRPPAEEGRTCRAWSAAAAALVGAACQASSPTPAPAADSRGELSAQTAQRPPAPGPPVREDGTILATTELMGTRWSIVVWIGADQTSQAAGLAIQAAYDEVARIESLASEWREDSELSALNDRAGGEPLVISPELFEVLEASRTISAATDGAFDVTFHGVGKLWSFTPGSRPPSREAVAQALPLVDWRGVELDPDHNTARLAREGMAVGLGGIAKGYAVDRASRVLTALGFADHVVEGGGDTYVSGTKGGTPWHVGVQDPEHARGAIGALEVRDEAVVTSGNYQRFFEHEGERYAHIIDPRTGWPIPWAISPRSVTIVARDATTADAYGTAVAVMGTEAGARFIEVSPELEGIILAADGTVWVSSGLEARLDRR